MDENDMRPNEPELRGTSVNEAALGSVFEDVRSSAFWLLCCCSICSLVSMCGVLDQRVRGVVGREEGGVELSDTRELARDRGALPMGVYGEGEWRLELEFLEAEAAYEWSSSPSLGVTRLLVAGSLPFAEKGPETDFQLSLRGADGLSFERSSMGWWQPGDVGVGMGAWVAKEVGRDDDGGGEEGLVNGSPVPLGRHRGGTGRGSERVDVSSCGLALITNSQYFAFGRQSSLPSKMTTGRLLQIGPLLGPSRDPNSVIPALCSSCFFTK